MLVAILFGWSANTGYERRRNEALRTQLRLQSQATEAAFRAAWMEAIEPGPELSWEDRCVQNWGDRWCGFWMMAPNYAGHDEYAVALMVTGGRTDTDLQMITVRASGWLADVVVKHLESAYAEAGWRYCVTICQARSPGEED
jgi:hypothetical protein